MPRILTAARRPVEVAAAGLAIALIPLGWALYFAKLADLVDRDSLDVVASVALLASGAVAGLAVLARLPRSAGAGLVGFALAPAAAWALGASPLVATFAYGTALLLLGWLLARRRPAGASLLRGRGGAVLVVVTPALVGLAALSGLAAWIRVLGTLAALVAAGVWLQLAGAGSRVVAGFLTVVALALLVLEFFVFYDIYPLLPVALAAGLAFVAGIPYFLAATSGRAALPRRR